MKLKSCLPNSTITAVWAAALLAAACARGEVTLESLLGEMTEQVEPNESANGTGQPACSATFSNGLPCLHR